MHTNGHEPEEALLHGDLVFRIVGCSFEVIKELGHGLHEKPYENALVAAFQDTGIAAQQQAIYPIRYKGRHVGEYIPDLIAGGAVVVDAKVIERITGLRVGLIINFKRAKLEWERVIL